jgi:hypothetical protein
MRVTRGLGAAALAVVFALAVTGCVPQSHKPPPPTPSPSSTPVFASDEEALAAATKAYAAYLEVEDRVAEEGGNDIEQLSGYVTTDQLMREREAFKVFLSSGKVSRGASSFDTVSLEKYSTSSEGTTTLSLYLCLDVSNVRILGTGGVDVTPAGRPDRYPLEVDLQARQGSDSILVSRSDAWRGDNFCA